tara:strand:+ start:651 stop:1271 length:621 start_codon:yes stop_codon:yes gene_type:complete
MNSVFEINKLDNMEMKIFVLCNCYEDPGQVRKDCLTRYKYGKNTPYGINCEGYLNENVENIFKDILKKSNKKVNNVNAGIMFVNKYHSQYIHRDCEEYEDYFTSVVYLNENYSLETGTKIIEPDEEEIQIISHTGKDIDNNTYLQYVLGQYNLVVKNRESIVIQAEYNKLIVFPAKIWHSVSSGFGDNKLNSRLSQSFYIQTNVIE